MSNSYAPTAHEDLLRVAGLSVDFPAARGRFRAVDDVSLAVGPGETVGIVGESGSGKSMMSRAIMQLQPPQAIVSGSVVFGGANLRDLPTAALRRLLGAEISLMFQDSATSLNPVVRIGRQLTESIELHLGERGHRARDRAVELLESVGIPDPVSRLRNYPHELSGGMRQRVCLALALACGPRLLIADEPTTALDVTMQRQVLDLMSRLQAVHSMALVLISHDLNVVAQRTERVVVMYAGQVVEAGSTRSIFANTGHPYTKALLESIPRLAQPSHTRLSVIPSGVVDFGGSPGGCRFAPRCRYAQAQCLVDAPELTVSQSDDRAVRCHFPTDTARGEAALAANLRAGRTPAGLRVDERSDPL